MPRPLQFWFEFASSYSYPAALRIGRLAAQAGLELIWRPFLLGPIFREQQLGDSPFNLNPAKGRYMWRDLERICAELGLPLRRPDPFPQPSLLAARVALVAIEQGVGEPFIASTFTAEFGEGRRIDDPELLAELLERQGVVAGPVLARAQSEPVKSQLRAQTEAAKRHGIFGAPSVLTADGELFWGNDRLEAAVAWAARGDAPRVPSD